MRTAIAAAIGIVLSCGIAARGNAIQYDQIPANVGSYFHFDVDQLIASRLATAAGSSAIIKERIKSFVGGPISAVTVYAGAEDDSDRVTVVIHTSDFDAAQVWEPRLAAAKDAVAFTYERHVVHYTSQGLEHLLNPPAEEHGPQTTHRAEKDHPTQPADRRATLSLGLGTGNSDPFRGPIFVAFVGQGLVVVTSALRDMADCLDVLDGRKPSLAREDPNRLKVEAPAGAVFVGVGLSANLQADTRQGDDRPARHDAHRHATHDATGGFNLNFLDSFSDKVTLGRFWGGENADGEYVHASLTMVDAPAAERLRNIALGLKGLISLSADPAQQPLIEPLTVRATDKDVLLDWTWPANKTGDLVRLIKETAGEHGSNPTTAPTTRAAR